MDFFSENQLSVYSASQKDGFEFLVSEKKTYEYIFLPRQDITNKWIHFNISLDNGHSQYNFHIKHGFEMYNGDELIFYKIND